MTWNLPPRRRDWSSYTISPESSSSFPNLLGTYYCFRTDPNIHFMHLTAAPDRDLVSEAVLGNIGTKSDLLLVIS